MRVNPGDIGRSMVIDVDDYGEVNASTQSVAMILSTSTVAEHLRLRMSPADVHATWRALGEVVQALELDDQ